LVSSENALNSHHLRYTLASVALAWSGCTLAAAADHAATPEPALRISRYAVTYTVKADGASTEERALTLAVAHPDVVASASKSVVSYRPGFQKVEVIEAYTRKPDGRHVDVPKTGLQDAPEEATGRHALTVSFPEVAAGDSVVLSYRLTNTVPLFKGHFSVHEHFSRTQAYDDVKITINAPAQLWTQHEARGLRELGTQRKAGRQITEWAWSNPKPMADELATHSGYEAQQEAGLAFSTFRSYGDLAQAYGQQAKPKVVATAGVKKLADQITKDAKATAPREVARALYDWVALNIGNEGTCLDVGATVPRDVDTVLRQRTGDCKDHATLLQSLLLAKGIQSTQVLINAGNNYGLSKVPLASMLNQVINFIPGLNLFADTTSDTTPFGMLPFGDEGKLAIVVGGFKEGLRTPVAPVGFNRQVMKTNVVVQPDGSAKGSVEVALRGMFAVNARARLRTLTPQKDTDLVKGFFESAGMKGSGTLVKDDPKALRDTYGYRTQFEVQRWLPLPGAGAFTIAPLFYSESPVADYLAAATQPVDEHAETSCSSGHSIEEYRYQLPVGMAVVSLPKNVKLDSDVLSYAATYELKGQVLTVKRVFEDRTVGNVCSPAMAKAYKEFAAKAVPDATAQVVFK
jgi:transglutaminase-like putative cysteine protease